MADGAKFSISGININVFSEDKTLIQKMENGARYVGGEHEVLLAFDDPNGEDTIVKVIPSDKIFLADKNNQAVLLSFYDITKMDGEAIYGFHTRFVNLASKSFE